MLPELHFHRSTDDEWQAVFQNVGNAFGERDYYWLNYDPIYPRDGSADLVCGSLATTVLTFIATLCPLLAFNNGDTDQ